MLVTPQSVQPPASESETAFVRGMSVLVRAARAKRGLTRRQMADTAGLSERYIAQVEAGDANPSVLTLRAIAQALECQLHDLLPASAGERDDVRATLMARVDALSGEDMRAALRMLESLEQHTASSRARAQRVALVGLRGAGKSTLGRMLAERLDAPFIELNKMIEEDYGASLALLIENSGLGALRRYEKAALERVLVKHQRAVIATAGGMVSNPETYALLLRHAHTVWLKASPQEHMGRVMEQGDFRPMARNREAMADLKAILDARSTDYARADAQLDTAGKSIKQSLADLQRIANGWMRP